MLEELWPNIADNLSDALLVQDKNGNIIFANSAAINLFGYGLSEALTFNSYKLFESGITNVHIFAQLLKAKRTVTSVQVVTKKDLSRTAPLLVTQTPIFDEIGNVKYSIEVFRDIDMLNLLYQKTLQKATDDGNIYHGDMMQKSRYSSKFVVASKIMEDLIRLIDRVADSNATILIHGESGTGKELLAEYIHKGSTRHTHEMITINCAALPENLLESELFGYEKGSFTGAMSGGKLGLIEMAHKGTLFLDEIDSLPLTLQAKLLRVLETKQVRRVGAVTSKIVDFRLIVATNTNLEEAIQEKRFRADLYHRLNILPFSIPPLRERVEEIRPLCDHFLDECVIKYERRKWFSEKVLSHLEAYPWPGNVRELRNLVERIVLMTDSGVMMVDDIPRSIFFEKGERYPMAAPVTPATAWSSLSAPQPPYDHENTLRENVSVYEQWAIEKAVKQSGSLSKAAKLLGIDKSTLIRKRKV